MTEKKNPQRKTANNFEAYNCINRKDIAIN